MCLDALQTSGAPCLLRSIKDRGITRNFLTTASDDVIKICKYAERIMRMTSDILKCSNDNIVQKLCNITKDNLPRYLFKSLDNLDVFNFQFNHKNDLIDKMLKKFFKLRLHHETTKLKDKII